MSGYDDYPEQGEQNHMEPRRYPTTEELDERDDEAYRDRESKILTGDAGFDAMNVGLTAIYGVLSMPNK